MEVIKLMYKGICKSGIVISLLLLLILITPQFSFAETKSQDINLLVGEILDVNAVISTIEEQKDIRTLEIQWSVKDYKIASIDRQGRLIGRKEGSTVVTAKIENSKVKASFNINVYSTVTGMSLDKHELELGIGQTDTLTANVTPLTAFSKAVIWESSNDYVVSVNGNGGLKGLKEGRATVTATTFDGRFIDRCEIIVKPMVQGMKIIENKIILNINESKNLSVIVYPLEAYDKTILYSLSNSEIVKVDKKGKVTAVKEGTTKIFLKTLDGNFKGYIDIEVVLEIDEIFIMNKESEVINFANLKAGEIINIKVTSNRTNPNSLNGYKIEWTSSDSKIARIGSKGNVLGVSEGIATITGTLYQDKQKAKVDLIVKVKSTVNAVTLDKTYVEMRAGEEIDIMPTVYPLDAYNKDIIWTSSDRTIAKVIKDKIVALKDGEVTLSATTKDGEYTATCNVVVLPSITSITVPETDLTMYLGDIYKFTPTITPDDALVKSTKFDVSNKNIIKVGKDRKNNYKIEAIAKGKSKITITTFDGNKSVKINVNVVQRDFSLKIYDSNGNLITEN
ncbi:MAG: Ig-like surface protein [Clostridiaceae bacterium]|jgi:uncharacterized protein YjdB|nr:Ig-like surface protein [Clostridiaceae bacterium]